jgi:hypothetical protein
MQTCKVTCPAWRRPRLVLIVVLLITAIPTYTQAQAVAAPLSVAADRVAIRELIDAYAHDADRRETEKQVALFTPDAILENIHNEPGKDKETTVLRGQKDLAAGFATLKSFEMTMHFNGRSTIEIHGDTATGETYCLAHHIFMQNGQRCVTRRGRCFSY